MMVIALFLYMGTWSLAPAQDHSLYTRKEFTASNGISLPYQKIPFWLFHGDADAVVSVSGSRDMVAKLKSLGYTVTYTEYPGINHNSWENAFKEKNYLPWMFSQMR